VTERPNTHWEPLVRRDNDPDFEQNPMQIAMYEKYGVEMHDEVWVNDRYQVVVRFLPSNDPDLPQGREGMMHLSIHRFDRRRLRDWRHLQQMKNEIAGEDRWAVEVFPSEDKLVDTSNEYHLWVLPEGESLPFAFNDGIVTSDEQVERFNEAREQGLHKGRQHPWEEGLTTGRNEKNADLSERDAAAFDDVLRRDIR
jgi:hypothetical protein